MEDAQGNYIGPVEIYMLTAPNNKKYIGQTQSYTRNAESKNGYRKKGVQVRWGQHKRAAEKPDGRGTCLALARSMRKYNVDDFKVETLLVVNKHLADMYETKFIHMYDTIAPNGLNLKTEGVGGQYSAEARKNLSLAAAGRVVSEAGRALLSISRRNRPKKSGLPNYIVQLAPRGTNAAGYRVQVYCKGKAYRTEFTNKAMTMEEKLQLALSVRDAMLKEFGLPPVQGGHEWRCICCMHSANVLTTIYFDMQGLERSLVPSSVVEAVREEFRRQRVTDKRKMTKAAVRRHLKRLKKSKYYDHSAQIAKELSGIQEVVIPPDVQQKIKIL